jgi:hypothetical protein
MVAEVINQQAMRAGTCVGCAKRSKNLAKTLSCPHQQVGGAKKAKSDKVFHSLAKHDWRASVA